MRLPQKSLSMIHVKDLLSVTGYVRGGCTAVGMKKQYPVFIDQSALSHDQIVVSGGRIGLQIELSPRISPKAAARCLCRRCAYGSLSRPFRSEIYRIPI